MRLALALALAATVPAGHAVAGPGPLYVDAAAAPGEPAPQSQAQAALLSIRHDPANGNRPVLRVGPVLAGEQLEQAARSGLPVRVRIRAELWRDRFFDQLVDSTSWSTVIVYEPLGNQFFARVQPSTDGARRFASFQAARTAVEGFYTLQLRPTAPGRYYYTTTLQVETLSLSDLDELERWLQGELQPAVSGQRSVPAAVGQGARRLMLRLLDLPQRRIDARSERFQL
jgi:hypothetical protein